ncbi:MAG: DUF4097 family beta strand repeat protein [Acidobacteria bacterium]|nr:DUF4097 family beta strand repeat protein [Acidobacteriota bacterium]
MKKVAMMSILIVVALSVSAQAQLKEETFALPENARIKVNTVAGDVQVIGWDNPGEVLVKSDTQGEFVWPEIEMRGSTLYINEKHEEGVKNQSHGAVHFEIYLPLNTDLKVNTVSGDIRCENMLGDVKLNNVSGLIVCALADGFRADASANTVSGTIEFMLNGSADAAFSANTLSGKITSHQKLNRRKESDNFVSTQLKGEFGNGYGRIKANSVSGDIIIR